MATTTPPTPGASATGSMAPPASESILPSSPSPSASIGPRLSLVVLGDSIPIKRAGCGNSCDGFDELYGAWLETRRDTDVVVTNLARGNARIATLREALDEPAVSAAVASADIVVVSIGYNDEPPRTEADAPCPVPEPPANDDGSALVKAALTYSTACIEQTMDWYAPSLDSVYGRIAELAGDRPQVRMTIGVFNNWIGHPVLSALPLSPAERAKVNAVSKAMKDIWNARDCAIAASHGFTCVDMYHAFNGPKGDQPIDPWVGGDYVHPTAEGHARIAELLEAVDLSALD